MRQCCSSTCRLDRCAAFDCTLRRLCFLAEAMPGRCCTPCLVVLPCLGRGGKEQTNTLPNTRDGVVRQPIVIAMRALLSNLQDTASVFRDFRHLDPFKVILTGGQPRP